MRSSRRTLCFVLLTVVARVPLPVEAATDEPGIVVSAEWVHERLRSESAGLVLLHVGPEGSFKKGHLPGASRIGSMEFSDPNSHSHDSLVLELPNAKVFQAELRERGVSDDSRVVVYWVGEWVTAASRLVFTLDWAGLGDRTSLLDGGLAAWKKAGFDVSKEPTDSEAGDVTVRPRDIVVGADWVQEHQYDERYRLVDARAGSFFDGVAEDRGAFGHIPGAGSLPWTSLVDEETLKLHSREKLRELLVAAGVEPGDIVVGYCHIGLFTTLALLTARLFDHEVLLYDGAFQDWAGRRLPTE